MSNIDEIKARIDILDLASEAGVKLRRSGRNYTGFCPFHSNTKTPAFVIWPESGTWRCFGECGEGGDIFKFVMKKENVDFKEALARLAERAGVQLEEFSPQKQEQVEENDRLRNLLEDAVIFYRHNLLQTEAGKPALEYLLTKRALTMQTIEAFGLGYAPAGWDHALRHFTARNYTEKDLMDVGLLSERDSGGFYDKFRNRIMIPIRDQNGRMTGFGARILDPNDIPKFMNSPQTVLFDKGHLLYGLDRARKPIRAADQVVIVEGYLDVIAVHQAGFENVVSPMGTALTEDQLRMLKRFTRRIVLALDPDTAGQKAVLRGLDAARSALDRDEELRFDARGLLRHEARLQADLRVANLPDDLDPDEIVERNPEEWKQLIENAVPIVEHVLETLLADKDVSDHKVKAEIAAQVMPLIEDLPNPIERDSYRQMLARRLKVDERALVSKPVTGGPAPARRVKRPEAESAPEQQKKPQVRTSTSPVYKLETSCLAILLRRPEMLSRLDRVLQEAGLRALNPADFGYTDHQMMLKLIQQSVEQDAAEQKSYVESQLDDSLQETYKVLMALPASSGTDDRLLEEVTRLAGQLRTGHLNEEVNQVRFLMEDSTEAPRELARMHLKLVQELALVKKCLDDLGKKRKDNR